MTNAEIAAARIHIDLIKPSHDSLHWLLARYLEQACDEITRLKLTDERTMTIRKVLLEQQAELAEFKRYELLLEEYTKAEAEVTRLKRLAIQNRVDYHGACEDRDIYKAKLAEIRAALEGPAFDDEERVKRLREVMGE